MVVLGAVVFVLLIGASNSPSLIKLGPTRMPGGFLSPETSENRGTSGSSVQSGSQTSTQGSGTQISPSKKGPMQLVFPNGGEVWQRGSHYNVRWNTDLAKTVSIVAVLFPTEVVINDPYATHPGTISGVEMFTKSIMSRGANDGSYSYRVPDTLPAGTYQVLLWGGDKCSPSNFTKKCSYDISDGLITVK